MRLCILILVTLLAACDSPSPQFFGAPKAEVAVGGMRFSVHRRADAVEVYRLGFLFRPSESAVLANAERAIEIATGCRAVGLTGDQALIKARLDCGAPLTAQPVDQRAG